MYWCGCGGELRPVPIQVLLDGFNIFNPLLIRCCMPKNLFRGLHTVLVTLRIGSVMFQVIQNFYRSAVNR